MTLVHEEMIMNNSKVLLVSLLAAIGGCASEPVPQPEAAKIFSGDQMLRESQGMAQLGSRWQQGKQKVDQGQEMVRQGQAKIEAGQALIEEGQKIMQESEESYKAIKK